MVSRSLAGFLFIALICLVVPANAEELFPGEYPLSYSQKSVGNVAVEGSFANGFRLLWGTQEILRESNVDGIAIAAALPDLANPQILILTSWPGGNSCDGWYRIIDMRATPPTVSKEFGNCAPTAVRLGLDEIVFSFYDHDSPVPIGWAYGSNGLSEIPRLTAEQHVEQGISAYDQGNFDEALRHFWLARDNAFPEASYYLGLMAHVGNGVVQDYAEAMALYKRAADMDYSPAYFRIGTLYANGRGVEKDARAAVEWYRKAAELGDGLGAYNLGLSYLTGLGSNKSASDGLFWMMIASERLSSPKEVEDAETNIRIAKARMTPDGVNAINSSVGRWKPRQQKTWSSPRALHDWVGHYPFDHVRGYSFFEVPQIRDAVRNLLDDDALHEMQYVMTQSEPIAGHDGWIVAEGCLPHDGCGQQWTVAINENDLSTSACIASSPNVLASSVNVVHSSTGTQRTEQSEPYRSDHCPDIKTANFVTSLPGSAGTTNRSAMQSSLSNPTTTVPLQPNAGTQTVAMREQRGTFVVPVTINGAITINFIVDSGAADVDIPADVVLTLMRTGTIAETDFLGSRTYKLADGSTAPSETFRIRSLKVGDVVIQNVTGSVGSTQGDPLLGESFLKRFNSWSIDNRRHALVLGAPLTVEDLLGPPPQ